MLLKHWECPRVELGATDCGENTLRLTRRWQSFLMELEQLDRVMALTRNEYAVSRKKRNIQKYPISRIRWNSTQF